MIPAGYLAKRVSRRPEWFHSVGVEDIYSVSNCISEDFADYIDFWRHNGFWLFDSPGVIAEIAKQAGTSLSQTVLFYYEIYEQEYDEERGWSAVQPEPSFGLDVVEPTQAAFEGIDVVTVSQRTNAEHSPLSCNGLASELEVNKHCLLPSVDSALESLESGNFNNTEPGPFRVLAVYSTD